MKITLYFNTEEGEAIGLLDAFRELEKKGIVKVIPKEKSTHVRFDFKTKKRRKTKESKEVVVSDGKEYTFPKLEKDNSITIAHGNEEVVIAEMIHRLKDVNPGYKEFYSHRGARSAMKKVLKAYDIVLIFKVLDHLKFTNTLPYAPIITTPSHLKNRLPTLLAFLQKRKKDKGDEFKMNL